MNPKQSKKLIIKVLAVGGIIAILIYLFHPGVGHLNITINGEPVADPLIRFAAIPTFLAVMGITCLLMVLLFLGFGVLMFLGCLFVALMATALIAPYFWPMLVIIFLIIALTAFSYSNQKEK
jgi:hypothetical protein